MIQRDDFSTQPSTLDEPGLQLRPDHALKPHFLEIRVVRDVARRVGDILEVQDVAFERHDVFHVDRAYGLVAYRARELARGGDAVSFRTGQWSVIERQRSVLERHTLRAEALHVADLEVVWY